MKTLKTTFILIIMAVALSSSSAYDTQSFVFLKFRNTDTLYTDSLSAVQALDRYETADKGSALKKKEKKTHHKNNSSFLFWNLSFGPATSHLNDSIPDMDYFSMQGSIGYWNESIDIPLALDFSYSSSDNVSQTGIYLSTFLPLMGVNKLVLAGSFGPGVSFCSERGDIKTGVLHKEISITRVSLLCSGGLIYSFDNNFGIGFTGRCEINTQRTVFNCMASLLIITPL